LNRGIRGTESTPNCRTLINREIRQIRESLNWVRAKIPFSRIWRISRLN
jgi:hypothetical protein